MKTNNRHFCQTLNSVKKSNGLRSYLWLTAISLVFFISRIMRILNY